MIKLGRTLREQGYIPGELPASTGLGSYPIFYVVRGYRDEGCWCARCCNIAQDPECTVIACGVNWEDPDMHCEACDDRIESAYAENESENDDV